MSILQETRHAVRSLRRSPGFAFAAILILALGIGANTAIFSLADAVLFRPLPAVGDPAALVSLQGDSVSLPLYETLRDEARETVAVAARSQRSMALTHAGESEMAAGLVVSANYFDVLRTQPHLGRFFGPSEDTSPEAVAVLAHGLWQRRFGADPTIVGRTIIANGAPVTIIGVAPRSFRGEGFGVFPDLWVPLGTWPRLATGPLAKLDVRSRNWGWLTVFGRRASGVTLEGARATLLTILERDAAAHGEEFDGAAWAAVPTVHAPSGGGADLGPSGVFAILGAAVMAALLIACANLANLLLARAAGREREIALRQALGATRTQIARSILVESAVLAFLGAAAGFLAASWTLAAVTRVPLMDGFTLALFEPRLGIRALVFAAGLAAVVAVAFGLLPALRASRAPAASILASSSSTLSRRSALKGALVAAQVALCLALLATSGLFGRSLARALSIDLGLRPDGVTLARVNLGLARYDAPRALVFAAELTKRLEAQPGIRTASWTSSLPISGEQEQETFEAEGYVPASGEQPVADVAAVGAGYFRALGTPVRAGREFDAEDRDGHPAVALVNEAMAARYFPGASPLGRRVTVSGATRTIVGVVADARSASLADAPVPQIWAPILQAAPSALSSMTLVVSSGQRWDAAAAVIREEIRGLDASLPVTGVEPYAAVVRARLLPQRLGAALLGIFGALSLVLAAVGIYAVVSWSTRRRTREFGIRLALGARASDVRRLVVRQMAASVSAGAATGLLLAVAAGQLLRGALYGIGPMDPVALGGATLVLAAAALLAAWVPARRASRLDPSRALRQE
jgi:predicted permease